MRVAQRLRAGTVWINAYRVVAPNVPFGGFGASGIGRENGDRRAARVHRDALDLDRDLRRDPRPVHARMIRLAAVLALAAGLAAPAAAHAAPALVKVGDFQAPVHVASPPGDVAGCSWSSRTAW